VRRARHQRHEALLRRWLAAALAAANVKREALAVQVKMHSGQLSEILSSKRPLTLEVWARLMDAVEVLSPGSLSRSRVPGIPNASHSSL
jgi:hypothetical protein